MAVHDGGVVGNVAPSMACVGNEGASLAVAYVLNRAQKVARQIANGLNLVVVG